MRLKTTAMLAIMLASLIFIGCNDKADTDEKTTSTEQTTAPKETPDAAAGADHLRMYYEGLHPADQKAMFVGLPPEMKHALWSSQLQHSLKAAKNDQERTYIQGIIDHLKPAYYSDSALYKKEGWGYFSEQAGKVFSVFGNDTARAVSIMYKIGGNPNAARILQVKQPDCICNIKDDWCGSGEICSTDNCTKTLIGCGWWGLEPCDGWCLHKRPGQ